LHLTLLSKYSLAKVTLIFLAFLMLLSCRYSQPVSVDILIKNATVYTGASQKPSSRSIGICDDIICFIGNDDRHLVSKQTIDATGLILTPGFIDPHTHSLEELLSKENNFNENYLTQGVTSVLVGNDGGGTPHIKRLRGELENNGIGTNVGFLVGHGSVRKKVMGLSNSPPTQMQLEQMKGIIEKAIQEGALGFSTGLYYSPGSYSNTGEIIELAKVAAKYDVVYDSHIRDESTFNIGFINAIKEVIDIAKATNIRAHVAHIKALGVDVWGQGEEAIKLINSARLAGVIITADQYPWDASGTFLHNAIIPTWLMADSEEAFNERLKDQNIRLQILSEIKENIRKRGGADKLLVTASSNAQWLGKTLEEIAKHNALEPELMAIKITLIEKVRIASFNMSQRDLKGFMRQTWVVSSSDGTNGHPRKYASFPKKYKKYVKEEKTISLSHFINSSTLKTANIFKLEKRGEIAVGNYADINLINLEEYQPNADFSSWNKLSSGVIYQLINGDFSINNGIVTKKLSGRTL
jgi:N-acyl-D-aspartate/D-glutamate deacylase